MDSSDFRSHLTHLIEEARSRAAEHGQRVVVSVSERIPSRDPLAVLDTLRRSSSLNSGLAGAYWTRPAENFAIAAFGAAAIFSPSGPERFSTLAREWRALIQNAVREGAASTSGVGPILIGGFSFDPEGPQTRRWANFPSSHMILPRAHVTSVDGECWLTLSAVIEHGESENVNDLTALRELILSADGPIACSDVETGADIQTSDDQPEDEWCELVDDAVKAIRSGAFKKVVLARSVSGITDSDVDAMKLLDHLRSVHRDAFVFGYWRGRDSFVGASPERLVRLAGGRLSASSLAGTIKRGDTPEEDTRLARELQGSEKDLAEHAAVREMLHEVLSKFDERVESSDTPELLTLSNVHHLHTEVRATLHEDDSILDVVARLHPTPAVGGSPRREALDFIAKNEKLDRGWYAAPIGWMDRNGGEFAVALRSGLIRDSEFTLFAGCGIVADSDPEQELAESNLKLQPMRSAIAASIGAGADDTEMALASRDTE